jgi:hypothetical protein
VSRWGSGWFKFPHPPAGPVTVPVCTPPESSHSRRRVLFGLSESDPDSESVMFRMHPALVLLKALASSCVRGLFCIYPSLRLIRNLKYFFLF